MSTGALFFGNAGDVKGRVPIAFMCLCLAGTSSLLTAALPGYHTWGAWSLGLLLILRAIYGISIGGLWAGLILIAYEYCGRDRNKGFYSSFPQAGRALGSMITIFLLQSLDLHDMLILPLSSPAGNGDVGDKNQSAWNRSWRSVQLVNLGLIVMAIYLKCTVADTPSFERTKRKHRILRLPVFQVGSPSLYHDAISK